MTRPTTILAGLAAASLVAGCTVGPAYVAPQSDVAPRFDAAGRPTTQPSALGAGPVAASAWWQAHRRIPNSTR